MIGQREWQEDKYVENSETEGEREREREGENINSETKEIITKRN